MLANRLGMKFDIISGQQSKSNAFSTSNDTLLELATKVRQGNPSRIIYITEANKAFGIFDTLEAMIDGTGIKDPKTGKITTFENAHFILDANVESAHKIARDFGFSESTPDRAMFELSKLNEEQLKEVKDRGEFTYNDSNQEARTIKLNEHPDGVVRFTEVGLQKFNEAVKKELGGREAFMGRAGDPIAVGYLSLNSYKAAVDWNIANFYKKL